MTGIGKQLQEAERQLCGDGAPFALSSVTINGQSYRQFAQAPDSLRELLDSARSHGDAEFLCYAGSNGEKQRYSFTDFFRRVDALANALVSDLGLQQGQRVAIAMRNSPEWLEIYAATVSLGAIVVPLNSWGSADDLSYVLRDSAPTLLFCDGSRFKLVSDILEDIPCSAILVGNQHVDSVADYEVLLACHADRPMPTPWPNDIDAPAQIMYSSGTSGRPKGVMSSQRNIIQAILSFECQAMSSIMVNPDALDKIMNSPYAPTALLAVPLFHVSGCYASFLLHLRAGRRIVMMHKWQAEQALTLIEEEKVTIFSAAPAMLIDLLQHPDCNSEKIVSLFSLGSGGAACPERVRQLISQHIEHSYTGTGYGMTESNAIGSSCVGLAFNSKAGSAGTLSPLVEFKTCDPLGHELPAGSQGEIYLRSVCNAGHYWQGGLCQEIMDQQGFLPTGDIGFIDEDGFVFVTDRVKDVIIRGGENIYPAEVEAVIGRHPDIVECAVIGLSDERLGERVALVYRPRAGASVDLETLHEEFYTQLAVFKRPVQSLAVTCALPRNPSGKLRKSELSSWFSADSAR